MDLRGAVALVTGASRGVGRAIALALAEAGADLACAARATDVSPLRLPGTIDETVRGVVRRGRRGVAIPTDLAVPDQVEAMVARAIATFGRLDVLVNNAAITFPGDLELPMRRWDLVLDVNLRAPLLAMRAALPGMIARRHGAVLNVSSGAAVVAVPGLLAYGVSKAGLERLTIGAAEAVRMHEVAVNCLRIDVPLASEGFLYDAPHLETTTDWEAPDVGAACAHWMLAQPPAFTGQVRSITGLREQGVALGRSAASDPEAGR